MSRLVVRCFSLSLDGFGAGPRQDLEHPLGVGGPEMFGARAVAHVTLRKRA